MVDDTPELALEVPLPYVGVGLAGRFKLGFAALAPELLRSNLGAPVRAIAGGEVVVVTVAAAAADFGTGLAGPGEYVDADAEENFGSARLREGSCGFSSL